MPTTDAITPVQLAQFEPVCNLPSDQIAELAATAKIEALDAGRGLFKAGESDNRAIFLVEGDVRLEGAGHPSMTVRAGSPESQKPLDYHQPRRYTGVTVTPARYFVIERDLLEAMLIWGQVAIPEPEVVMSEDGVFTVDKASWLKKMLRSPTFKKLPAANIETLLDRLEPVRVKAGQIIIRQGDPGDYFYMIHKGIALVNRQTEADEDESIEMAELAEGSAFGEAALISDKPRNATVSMTTDGILLRLSKDDFLKLLNAPNTELIEFRDALVRVGRKNAVWLDIRLAKEFADGHLPGALNIPVQQLHRRARELDKKVAYICYCDSGQRSSAAAFVLKQYALSALVLVGGLEKVPDSALEKSA